MRIGKAVLVATVFLAGCGGEPCKRTTTIDFGDGPVLLCMSPLACGDVDTPSMSATAPAIRDGALASQLAQDPWTLVVTLDFNDADGNLAAGNVTFYLGSNGDSATRQDLLSAFKQSALPEDATSGQLVLPLRFDESVGDGAHVELGIQLTDGGGLHSNCYGMTLSFEVQR